MKNVKKQFLIAGLGNFGRNMALALEELGCDVIAIDSDEEKVQDLSRELTYVVCGNAADEKNLRDLGAEDVDTAIVAIDDLESSVLCTLLLKGFGVKNIVARAHNAMHGKILEKIGANRVIYPERDTARRIAYNLHADEVIDYMDFWDETGLIQLQMPKELVGKSIIEANLRQRFDVNITSIKRGGKNMVNPSPKEIFQADDCLVLFGRKESLSKLREEMK